MEQEIKDPGSAATMVNSPILNPRIFMSNTLPQDHTGKNDIHVIITPNYDYALAEVIVGFAKFANSFGTLGSVSSALNLLKRLRTLSLIKKTQTIVNVTAEMKKNSVTVRPGQIEVDVYDAFREFSLDVTSLITKLGGKGLSVLVVTGDMKNATIFNSALDSYYMVDDLGVSHGSNTELHAWNRVSFFANLLSDVSPCLVRLGDGLDLLYRSKNAGGEKRINFATYDEGHFSSPKDHVLCPRKQIMDGVGATDVNGKLCIAARGDGSDIFFRLYNKMGTLPSEDNIPDVFQHFGHKIVGRPTATTFHGRMVAVARSADGRKKVIVASDDFNTVPKVIETPFSTDYPPAICAYKDRLYMVCAEEVNGKMTLYSSHDGGGWSDGIEIPYTTSASPALVVYKGKMYLIYRHRAGTAVLYAWTEDGVDFQKAPKGLDYFGFSTTCDVAAAAMPDESDGIMVAGLKPESWAADDMIDLDFSFGHTEDAIIWTTFVPSLRTH